MKWVVIVLGVLLAAVAIVFVVGSLLPRDHVAGSSIVVRQPRDSVWHAVRDLASLPSVWNELLTSQRTTDTAGREVWEQKMKNGFTMRLIVTEDRPPERLEMTIDAPPDAPFGGTWTYEVTPADGGTKLTVTERGYVNSPLFRFMSRFIFGHHATQDGYLKAMGKKLGEDVTPTHATIPTLATSNK
jgi:uncharacterized protein YndB with AHSA1/START domain